MHIKTVHRQVFTASFLPLFTADFLLPTATFYCQLYYSPLPTFLRNLTVKINPMKWYHFILSFLAGMFLTNVVPHFIHGVSGDPFPSPFSDPPGIGLSSPTVNVCWALFNLLVGYLLFKGGKVSSNKWLMLTFFIGIVAMSLMLADHFQHKMTA